MKRRHKILSSGGELLNPSTIALCELLGKPHIIFYKIFSCNRFIMGSAYTSNLEGYLYIRIKTVKISLMTTVSMTYKIVSNVIHFQFYDIYCGSLSRLGFIPDKCNDDILGGLGSQ